MMSAISSWPMRLVLLQGIFTSLIAARPPPHYSRQMGENVKIEVFDYNDDEIHDLETKIQILSDQIGDISYNWASNNAFTLDLPRPPQNPEYIGFGRVNVTIIPPGGYTLTRFEDTALRYGLLTWMREWRDEGFIAGANWRLTWTGTPFPGNPTRVMTGCIGNIPIPQAVNGNALSGNTSAIQSGPRKRQLEAATQFAGTDRVHARDVTGSSALNNSPTAPSATPTGGVTATRLSAIPPDPWQTIDNILQMTYTQTISRMGSRSVAIQAMKDLNIDAWVSPIWEYQRRFRAAGSTISLLSAVQFQPSQIGEGDAPKFFLQGLPGAQVGLSGGSLTYAQLYLTLCTFDEYVHSYVSAGRTTVPSVGSFYARAQMDWGGAVTETRGWWGNPDRAVAAANPAAGNANTGSTGTAKDGVVQTFRIRK